MLECLLICGLGLLALGILPLLAGILLVKALFVVVLLPFKLLGGALQLVLSVAQAGLVGLGAAGAVVGIVVVAIVLIPLLIILIPVLPIALACGCILLIVKVF
jgi:hypothetical protein